MEVISRASKTINGYDYTLSPTDKESIYINLQDPSILKPENLQTMLECHRQ